MSASAALRDVACAIAAAEVARLRGLGALPLTPAPWPSDMALGDDGLGIDSLERMGVTAALAEAFGREIAASDARPPRTAGDLIDWAVRGCDEAAARLTVATSGSTGRPRTCTHDLSDLMDEARHFAALLGDRRRVVAMVPAHHIYGVIWTALLPAVLGVPVERRAIGGALDPRDGDLIVAVPEQWAALLRLYPHLPAGVVGVTSGGPLAPALGEELLAAGLSRLLDIYGASETGGIGVREVPAPEYRLLPRWRFVADGGEWSLIDRRERRIALPDRVERLGEHGLRPVGRRDGAVQIAGHNVWPEQVTATLRSTAGVRDVAVRLGANGRLKAFVVPDAGVDQDALAQRLQRRAGEHLTDAARPRAYAFGAALPRNAMGKLTDWP